MKQWREQWNLAEGAMKIAEKTNEEYQAPSTLELRYSGRKIVECFDLVEAPDPLHSPEDKIKDAIYDCHRARHDATDHATSIIAARLDVAREKFGADAVRAVFPDYSKLVVKLADVRNVIAESREQRNGRGIFYTTIEKEHLPEIMEMFDLFKVAEPELENGYVKRVLAEAGVRYGWIVAIVIGLCAWLFPRAS